MHTPAHTCAHVCSTRGLHAQAHVNTPTLLNIAVTEAWEAQGGPGPSQTTGAPCPPLGPHCGRGLVVSDQTPRSCDGDRGQGPSSVALCPGGANAQASPSARPHNTRSWSENWVFHFPRLSGSRRGVGRRTRGSPPATPHSAGKRPVTRV